MVIVALLNPMQRNPRQVRMRMKKMRTRTRMLTKMMREGPMRMKK
jgi:hypothetical protein